MRRVFVLLELAVRLVDGAQQLAEIRRLYDRPRPIERRTEHIEVVPRKQTDGDDAFRLQNALQSLFILLNASWPSKCLAFRPGIGIDVSSKQAQPAESSPVPLPAAIA